MILERIDGGQGGHLRYIASALALTSVTSELSNREPLTLYHETEADGNGLLSFAVWSQM